MSILSADQLQQRTALALSQIFAVASTAVPEFPSENFVNYYDIFVRNAFGNYRNVLRLVSYSPMMADNLSYIQSKSHAHISEALGQFSLADENFAREVMQLFSIGTVLLNEDGTLKRDTGTGKEIDAYSNVNIMNFARMWTGFYYQKNCDNIEDRNENWINPMKIVAGWRDKFPKLDLDGRYIGDLAYPLCEDLPPKMLLTEGATYCFLGGSKLPEMMHADPTYLDDKNHGQV